MLTRVLRLKPRLLPMASTYLCSLRIPSPQCSPKPSLTLTSDKYLHLSLHSPHLWISAFSPGLLTSFNPLGLILTLISWVLLQNRHPIPRFPSVTSFFQVSVAFCMLLLLFFEIESHYAAPAGPNLVCRSGCPWTHWDSPTSASQAPRLKACVTRPGVYLYLGTEYFTLIDF